ISNALKFTNRKGSIVVYSLSKNNFIEIAVQDTGTGMTEQTKSKLFSNIYYTSTGTEGEAGSGFGLTIVKDLVEKNGGKIWVESEIGKGSTFYFTLPKS
nr:ATP-binding protein [Thermoflexibacter sp.]